MPMRASRSRTRDATNLLTATPDEFALGLGRFLLTARDLLCLRLKRDSTSSASPRVGQRRRCCSSRRRARGCGWRGAGVRVGASTRVRELAVQRDPSDHCLNTHSRAATSNCKIIGYFSINPHQFSKAILHYLCIFIRKYKTKLAFLL